MKAPSFGGGLLSTVPNYACPVLAVCDLPLFVRAELGPATHFSWGR